MNDCFYCNDPVKLQSLMIEICELDHAIIYLNRDQKHKGRLIVCFKEHKTEYFQLTDEENAGFFKDMSLATKALDELYHPDKINYATFGDLMPHAHMHIVPKYKDGLQWGAPFRDGGVDKMFLTDEEYNVMVTEIRDMIEKLK